MNCWSNCLRVLLLLSLSACVTSPISAAKPSPELPLKADAPIVLPGKAGHFDFMKVDSQRDRLLAAHPADHSLVIYDLKESRLIKSVVVGEVQGIDVDDKSETYILGDAGDHKVVFLSAGSLKILGEVKVTGPVDAVTVDPENGLAYAGEDDGNHLWVFNIAKRKLVATIDLSGVPEFVAFSPNLNRILQNIKTKDTVAIIDPKSNRVLSEWKTAPVVSPHGLAVDEESKRIFIAGSNGVLVALDGNSGKVVSQAEIAPKTDQIVFDPAEKIVYSASKGFVSATKVMNEGLQALPNTPAAKGAHTIAVDPVRHDVWIAYSDDEHSYLQRFLKTAK